MSRVASADQLSPVVVVALCSIVPEGVFAKSSMCSSVQLTTVIASLPESCESTVAGSVVPPSPGVMTMPPSPPTCWSCESVPLKTSVSQPPLQGIPLVDPVAEFCWKTQLVQGAGMSGQVW